MNLNLMTDNDANRLKGGDNAGERLGGALEGDLAGDEDDEKEDDRHRRLLRGGKNEEDDGNDDDEGRDGVTKEERSDVGVRGFDRREEEEEAEKTDEAQLKLLETDSSAEIAEQLAGTGEEIKKDKTEAELLEEDYNNPKTQLLAIGYMVGSTMSISVMSVLLKIMGSRGYPPFELVVYRSLFILLISMGTLWKQGISPFGPPILRIRLLLLLRGLCGFGGFSSLIYSVLHLPLSDAVTLTYTSPIFSVIFAWLILKESISWVDVLGLFLNMGGVLSIAQPSFLFPHSNSTVSDLAAGSATFDSSASASGSMSFSSSSSGFFDERTWAVMISFVGALSASGAFVAVKLVGKSAPPIVLVGFFAMVSTAISLIITLTTETWVKTTSVFEMLCLLAIGATGFGAQVLVNTALQIAKAGKLANIGYLSIVWAFIWQMVIFGTAPSLTSFLGALLISSYAVLSVIKSSPELQKKIEDGFIKFKRVCFAPCRWKSGDVAHTILATEQNEFDDSGLDGASTTLGEASTIEMQDMSSSMIQTEDHLSGQLDNEEDESHPDTFVVDNRLQSIKG